MIRFLSALMLFLFYTGVYSQVYSEKTNLPFGQAIVESISGERAVLDKFGSTGVLGSITVPEDVWLGGGEYTGQPNGAAEALRVSSSDVDDNSTGTGARTVLAYGLDGNYDMITDTIVLNGTTNVVTTQTYLRVYRLRVLTAGASGGNEGVITVQHNVTTANVFLSVPTGLNQSQVCAWTVPDGVNYTLTNLFISLARTNGANGSGVVTLRVRPEGGVYNAVKRYTVSSSAPLDRNLENTPIVVGERSDILIRVESLSDPNSTMTAEFSGNLKFIE